MASTRKNMIEADEALIVIDAYEGKRIFRETTFFGEFGGFDFVRDFLSDRTVEIRRINTMTWEKAEDITEECARAWLIDDDADDENYVVYPDDDGDFDHCEKHMPSYVKNSKAWAQWKDDIRAETPVNPAPEWGTYHTINGHAA